MNAPAASLNSTTVYDARLVAQRIHDIEQQAQTVQDNYPSGVAEDLYAKMDAGELSPSEVRGAEGMVRYLSGNETSGDNLEFALRHTLDLEQPDDLDGTMVVHFNGETDRERTTDSNGTVSYEYAAVNETYEGMLFASGFPNETAETGTTYQVSDFDGQPSMLVNGSELVMWSGEFTIQEMYDSDGNAVETAQYSGPEYGTYNATEYVQGLDNASDARAEIVENETDGGGGIGFPDNPFDGGGGGAFVGLVIVGALVVVVAVVVVVQSDS
ncbi:hypothetical protein C485_07527 [Natrinema altunense JCM 12890]|uniref:Envelope protein N-terminal domain-containing protein n=2 Tax=Natrinema altunense TaxID=222984 RepID=L9ZJS6_NATA2|nr:hypothetical protein C485_07527 [Natrinema altunense JCM 12890]